MARARKRTTGKAAERRTPPPTWTRTVGERPYSVRLIQRTEGSTIHAVVYNRVQKRQRKVSLRHTDQRRAVEWARDQVDRLERAGEAAAPPKGPITVGRIMTLYLQHRPTDQAEKSASEERRRAALWTRIFGARPVHTLGRAEWEKFIRLRGAGVLDARGESVPEKERRTVGAAAIAQDLKFARSVFYWGCTWNDEHGQPLLERNPWAAPAPGVRGERVGLELPKNRAPRRPVATYDRYLAVRELAERTPMRVPKGTPGAVLVAVGMRRYGRKGEPGVMKPVKVWQVRSYLAEMLDLVEQTGRRRGAVCDLRVSDLEHTGRVLTAINWRPVKHETEVVRIIVSDETAATVERQLARLRELGRLAVGDAPLFPAPYDPSVPVRPEVADAWLRAAEAEVGHLKGGLWHPFRRKWATERKHLPDKDTAHVAGWKDIATMKLSYQQVDDATVELVVNEPRRLRDRPGERSGRPGRRRSAGGEAG